MEICALEHSSTLRFEMRGFTLNNLCQCGLFTYLVLFSFMSFTTAVSFDLTELRNKVAKIKVNPRGNLWATGKNQLESISYTKTNIGYIFALDGISFQMFSTYYSFCLNVYSLSVTILLVVHVTSHYKYFLSSRSHLL